MYGGKSTGLRWVGPTVLGVFRPVVVVSATPEDPDDDIAVVGHLDRDGNTVRSPRLWLRFSADGLRVAELSPSVRARPDRIYHRFVTASVARTLGLAHTFEWTDLRAGESGGLGALEFLGAATTSTQPPATDTTARLDRDGNSVIPASLYHKHFPDSVEPWDVVLDEDAKQDRWRQRFIVADPRLGHKHTVVLEDSGRAGHAGGLRALAFDGTVVADGQSKILGDLT